jgi:ABC-2 type transport system permease protein
MRPYLAILGARFRMLLQYRGAALGGIGTQSFIALMRIMVLEAFYASATSGPPLTFSRAVGYVWLGQATLAMQPYNVDRDVREMVRTGAVGYELIRPTNLYALWYSRALAWRTAPLLLRLIPLLLVSSLLMPVLTLDEWALRPPSLAAAGAWILAMAGAAAVSSAITTLMSVSLLWTISGEGMATLVSAAAGLLSGLYIPLPLFPAWSQPVLQLLPFAALIDLPARLFTGDLPPSAIGAVLLHQGAWTVALVALGASLLRRATRQLVIQGG